MSMPNGTFVWYDHMSPDKKAAEAYYAEVCGWAVVPNTMNAQDYSILHVPGSTWGVGGLMPIPDDAKAAGMKATWSGYVGVDDVDAWAGKVKAAGGAIYRPPGDIPNVGRFAVVADPHGASFILFQPGGSPPPGGAPAPGTPGTFGWHELHAGDGVAAFAFYSGLFGWEKDTAIDMGPMGVYQTFKIGGAQAGGMMTKAPEMPRPQWLYYVNVEAIDAAAARATKAGGKILNGPMEVPGGLWIVQCFDPQGAMFAMVAPKR
ncbi:MAG: VOC family protein [Hyphomicrobiales bacterium]|nr:VOC family protein [Hyphomicrobiales bacterium]